MERGAGADTGSTTPVDGTHRRGWVAASVPAAPQEALGRDVYVRVSWSARVFLPFRPDFVSQDEIGDEAQGDEENAQNDEV